MEYFVYIIYSADSNVFYKGMSSDPYKRLMYHNKGLNRYTRSRIPWELVYIEKCKDKRSALIREKQLKKYNHIYIQELINSNKNILKA